MCAFGVRASTGRMRSGGRGRPWIRRVGAPIVREVAAHDKAVTDGKRKDLVRVRVSEDVLERRRGGLPAGDERPRHEAGGEGERQQAWQHTAAQDEQQAQALKERRLVGVFDHIAQESRYE